MDAVLTAVVGAAPELGGATALVVVLVILVRREVQTTERHSTELARITAVHDAEMAEMRAENTRLRVLRDAAEQAIDAERAARRAAQDGGRHRQDGGW